MAEFFRVHTIDSAQVIELFLPDTIDPLEFDRLNDSIQALLDQDTNGAAGRWVLDLGRVTYMGSAMLGLLVNLRHRIKKAGGRLVLCGLSARLTEIFRTCCMERLFTITRTRPEALRLTAAR
jgi:anti-anti-sigma factor